MSVFDRSVMGALVVAAVSVGTWIAVSAQGLGVIQLNCQEAPCDAVARGFRPLPTETRAERTHL